MPNALIINPECKKISAEKCCSKPKNSTKLLTENEIKTGSYCSRTTSSQKCNVEPRWHGSKQAKGTSNNISNVTRKHDNNSIQRCQVLKIKLNQDDSDTIMVNVQCCWQQESCQHQVLNKATDISESKRYASKRVII